MFHLDSLQTSLSVCQQHSHQDCLLFSLRENPHHNHRNCLQSNLRFGQVCSHQGNLQFNLQHGHPLSQVNHQQTQHILADNQHDNQLDSLLISQRWYVTLHMYFEKDFLIV